MEKACLGGWRTPWQPPQPVSPSFFFSRCCTIVTGQLFLHASYSGNCEACIVCSGPLPRSNVSSRFKGLANTVCLFHAYMCMLSLRACMLILSEQKAPHNLHNACNTCSVCFHHHSQPHHVGEYPTEETEPKFSQKCWAVDKHMLELGLGTWDEGS